MTLIDLYNHLCELYGDKFARTIINMILHSDYK